MANSVPVHPDILPDTQSAIGPQPILPWAVYTELEAARLLHLKKRQLGELRKRGEAPKSTLFGRQARYLGQDLLDYLRPVDRNDGRPGLQKRNQD